MEKQTKTYYSRKPPDTVFILGLLCIFALGSLMLIVFGANVYKDITKETNNSAQLRTVLSYITTKVRQSDAEGTVSLRQKEGQTALVLQTIDGGEPCDTWIYEYDGTLREVTVDEKTEFTLSDGMSVLPSYGLELHQDSGKLFSVKAYDEDGNSMETSVAVRSGNRGGGNE